MGLLWALLAAVLAAAATLAGVCLVLWAPVLTRRTSRGLVSLAGGVVLGAVFLHLMPEALALAPSSAWGAALVSFLALYLIESHTLPHIHGPHSGDPPGPGVRLGQTAFIGFAAHALFDGLAIGAAYRQGAELVPTALIAVFAHKIPEGMALFSLLAHGSGARRRALRQAVVVALMTPLSTVSSFLLLGDRLDSAAMGVALALVSGSFLYISASDLLPEVRRNPRAAESVLIIAGVVAMWLVHRLAA